MNTILLTLLVLFVQAAPPAVQAPPRLPGPAEYLVGPQDVLVINIHNQPDSSRPDGIVVEGDGTIDYPLIGRIKVAGLSTRQIADVVRDGMVKGGFLTGSPSVTVTVKDYRSQTVHVLGEVRTPGAVQLKGVSTLSEALSTAGHFTINAGLYVIIARGGTADSPVLVDKVDEKNKIRVERSDIESGRANGIILQDGDTILVPKAEVYYVTGQVKSPNEYTFKPNLTVLQAVTIAGGYNERAAKNRIEVQRVVNGQLKKIRVKETDFVQPRDTIHVPSRWF